MPADRVSGHAISFASFIFLLRVPLVFPIDFHGTIMQSLSIPEFAPFSVVSLVLLLAFVSPGWPISCITWEAMAKDKGLKQCAEEIGVKGLP